jgi:hypothetical protein
VLSVFDILDYLARRKRVYRRRRVWDIRKMAEGYRNRELELGSVFGQSGEGHSLGDSFACESGLAFVEI